MTWVSRYGSKPFVVGSFTATCKLLTLLYGFSLKDCDGAASFFSKDDILILNACNKYSFAEKQKKELQNINFIWITGLMAIFSHPKLTINLKEYLSIKTLRLAYLRSAIVGRNDSTLMVDYNV